jgi:hypothetical protein
MSKSFEPRFLCSKIHSSPHSCIPKFCAILWEFFPKYFYHQNPFIQFLILFLIQKSIKIDFSFYSFGFQPEQQFRPGLLPPFPAQPWPTSFLPFRPRRPVASPSLTGGPTLSVSPTVFHLLSEPPPPIRSVAATPCAAIHPSPALRWS